MTTKNLKAQIGWFIAGILLLAMLLVSLVWGMFLKKNMVADEIARLDEVSDAVRGRFFAETGGNADKLQRIEDLIWRNSRQCLFLRMTDGFEKGNEACFPDDKLAEVERKIKRGGNKVVTYYGTVWAVFTFSHEKVIVGKPLLDDKGGIVGAVITGSSLSPIYAQIRREGEVVFFYILLNTIILTGIGFIRMMQVVIKPIERFISLAQQHAPADSLNFFPENDNNEFATLSTSLNGLFSRIREDNEKLRATVTLLESANLQLEHNKNEMVRTEKLAAIGRLSAGLAHEIGNPLGIVQGYIDLLGRVDLSGEERLQFVQNSQHELDRIKTLLRQLLDFARPITFSKQQISVNLLAGEVIDFASVEKTFAHCTIIKQFEANPDFVLADADSLRQVLLNSLLNAADAMASMDGNKEILVTTYNSRDDVSNSFLHIALRDNGPGVVTKDLPYVFDPFFTTKETGRGTGLGLFVCHTIMERLGGSIMLRNNSSGGAEVLITLPATTDNSPAI